MQLSHLISAMDWIDVERSLLQQYPDARESAEGYRETFLHLRLLQPIATTMRIYLRTTFRPGLDDEPFLEIVGRNGTLNRDLEDFSYLGKAEDSTYALSEAEFAIELEPWSEWLGMAIDRETLAKYRAPEIVAHCLWEMTCFGFNEAAIDAQRGELQRRVDEIDAMTEEERKEKLIPAEQVFKRLDALKKDCQ
jgi:hypothetical protein